MSYNGKLFKRNIEYAKKGGIDTTMLGSIATDLVEEPRLLDDTDKSDPKMIDAAETLAAVKAHQELINEMSGHTDNIGSNEMKEHRRVANNFFTKLGERLLK